MWPPHTARRQWLELHLWGTMKSGCRRLLFVLCKMSLDSIWVLTEADTRHTMTLLTMGTFYCILSPTFYAGDFDRRGIMNTTKLTTEVTLVLFSLHACWNPPSTKYTVYQVRLNQYLTFLTEKGKTLRNGQHKGLLTITGRAVQFAWVWGERCKGNSVFYPGNIYV